MSFCEEQLEMKMSQDKGRTKAAQANERSDTAALPKAEKSPPFPELPAKMLIAIDGWAQSGKNSAGEKVAEYLGGVLVDSGRFYRAITKACADSGVDIGNADAVTAYVRKATLDVRLERVAGVVDEAQVAVNGQWFTKEELKPLGLQTSLVAAVPVVRSVVNSTLRMCESYGRVVMLGRDIGGAVFPATPYKFFLDATEEVREQRHMQSTNTHGAKQRDIYDASRVVFTEHSLLIDTSKLSVEEVCGVILVEVFWRAQQETGNKGSP
jgi:cytidylate kinase